MPGLAQQSIGLSIRLSEYDTMPTAEVPMFASQRSLSGDTWRIRSTSEPVRRTSCAGLIWFCMSGPLFKICLPCWQWWKRCIELCKWLLANTRSDTHAGFWKFYRIELDGFALKVECHKEFLTISFVEKGLKAQTLFQKTHLTKQICRICPLSGHETRQPPYYMQYG